uniref:Uncharacterized protein n=1 Tax=Arundo donax TaxID=35708 RepID=A0A0A9EIP8_ARUDO
MFHISFIFTLFLGSHCGRLHLII